MWWENLPVLHIAHVHCFFTTNCGQQLRGLWTNNRETMMRVHTRLWVDQTKVLALMFIGLQSMQSSPRIVGAGVPDTLKVDNIRLVFKMGRTMITNSTCAVGVIKKIMRA